VAVAVIDSRHFPAAGHKGELRMQNLWKDIRYAARILLNTPGFSLIAVATLALGIGANSAIFSVVNAVLLRPLPYSKPDQLVMIWEQRPSSGDARFPITGHEFVAWREQSRTLEHIALIDGASYNLTGQGEAVSVRASRVSSNYFSVLGVQPILGRTFAPEEDQSGGQRVVILSHALWRSRFGSDEQLIGKTASLNDQNYIIVGIMPDLEVSPELWVPMDLSAEEQKVAHSRHVLARMKTGVRLTEAQEDIRRISRQLEQQYPSSNTGHGATVISLEEQTTGGVRRALLVLLGAVACVLMIACANVAGLLLTRATSRQKEIAIRTALGASRGRIIRQLLTESLLLASIGGGIGLMLAMWFTYVLSKVEAIEIPRADTIGIDGTVLAATILFSILTGLLTGMAPALRTSKSNLIYGMSDGTRSSAGPARRRIGSSLAILQVALALVLLIGSGLMIRSFIRLMQVDPGFDPSNVLRLELALPPLRYPKPQQQTQFYEELIRRLETLPGVESVSASRQTPLHRGGSNWLSVTFEGRPAPAPGEATGAAIRSISSNYFRTMRIPLLKGRYFSDADARLSVPTIRSSERQPYPERFNEPQPTPVLIINETMARMFWPNEDPVGTRLRIASSPWFTVVGIVGDVPYTALHQKPDPEIYLSHQQEPNSRLAVMIRTAGEPLLLADAARAHVRDLDEDLPVSMMSMEQVVARSVAERRFNAVALSGFGGLALMLAIVGVFGVINYSVAQRTREIGIRIAFGAQKRDIFKIVMRQGIGLALAGVGIGVAGAVFITGLLSQLLYEVSPTDTGTFVAVSLLLIAVALLACWIPARRATRVDPIIALRSE
jgi:putative ABC transport system permease protein